VYFDDFLQKKMVELEKIKFSQKADFDTWDKVLKSTNDKLKILQEEFDPTFIENSDSDYEY
jgi:dsDNA-binding SOS-regulon protein